MALDPIPPSHTNPIFSIFCSNIVSDSTGSILRSGIVSDSTDSGSCSNIVSGSTVSFSGAEADGTHGSSCVSLIFDLSNKRDAKKEIAADKITPQRIYKTFPFSESKSKVIILPGDTGVTVPQCIRSNQILPVTPPKINGNKSLRSEKTTGK